MKETRTLRVGQIVDEDVEYDIHERHLPNVNRLWRREAYFCPESRQDVYVQAELRGDGKFSIHVGCWSGVGGVVGQGARAKATRLLAAAQLAEEWEKELNG